MKKPIRLTKKPLNLKLLYPAIATLLTLILVGSLALAIRSFHIAYEKVFAALAVSFLVVSLTTASFGDEGVLNRISPLMNYDVKDGDTLDYALAALKDGKVINLGLTAVFQIISSFVIMLS